MVNSQRARLVCRGCSMKLGVPLVAAAILVMGQANAQVNHDEFVINRGPSTPPGIGVRAGRFKAPPRVAASPNEPVQRQFSDFGSMIGPRPNMCTGLVSGT